MILDMKNGSSILHRTLTDFLTDFDALDLPSFTKFHVPSLFELIVYVGIAKAVTHVVTIARAAQLPMHTVRCLLAH